MKKLSILLLAGVFLMTTASLALAKKTPPPADIVDYDIVGFTCPQTVLSTETDQIEVRVLVKNVGTSDPGVPLQISEEDAFFGPTVVLRDTVTDEIQKGKQRAVEYVYTIAPPVFKQYIELSASLSDQNYTDDLDWAFCSTKVILQ